MPLFNAEKFANNLVIDLSKLKADVAIMKAASEDDRKEVIKKVLNKLIDIPGLPEFIEAIAFSLGVEYFNHLIKANLKSDSKDRLP